MTEAERQRIERNLQDIQAWRASGLPIALYAEQQGQTLRAWRGKLSWEGRWRKQLKGIPLNYRKPTQPVHAFVKATAPVAVSAPPSGMEPTTHLRLTLQSQTGGSLLAQVDWPVSHWQQCSQWLREVLA